MTKFNYVSLFSGIGGFELALNKLGGKCVFASEIDKHARKSYEAIHGFSLEGDIKEIDAKDVPNHDLLTAGFPCQAFSVAGKRAGFNDTRGTLFFDIKRIVAEKRPKLLLLENVKGLVGHDKGNTLDTIVEELNAIGYAIDFEVLNSKYFGVPQNRERIYIVGVREDLIELEPWNISKDRKDVVAKGKRRISGYEGVKTFNFEWPEQKEVNTRLRDILEDEVDEKYYLSEDKTAKLIEQLSEKDEGLRQIGYINKNMQGNRVYDYNGIGANIASQTGGLGGKGVSLITDNEPQQLGLLDMKGQENIRRVYGTEGVSPTLTSMQGGYREPKIVEEQIPYWIPKPNEINRTLRTGGKSSLSEKHNYDYIAEEVRSTLTPERENKRQEGRRFKENDEPAFTVNTQDRHGVTIVQYPKYRIRKLTPLECWRLQGFPDEAFYTAQEVGISNSQLYKQAGNAVTVNVVEAIGAEIVRLI